MPYRDFDAARRAYHADDETPRDPIEFTLAGERFRCLFEPSLGDTLDLWEAPEAPESRAEYEPDDEMMIELIAVLDRFIRRSLPDDGSRERYDAARYRIPRSESFVIIELAQYITEQVTGFPTTPPASSRGGRQPSGRTSKRSTGGKRRSR